MNVGKPTYVAVSPLNRSVLFGKKKQLSRSISFLSCSSFWRRPSESSDFPVASLSDTVWVDARCPTMFQRWPAFRNTASPVYLDDDITALLLACSPLRPYLSLSISASVYFFCFFGTLHQHQPTGSSIRPVVSPRVRAVALHNRQKVAIAGTRGSSNDTGDGESSFRSLPCSRKQLLPNI